MAAKKPEPLTLAHVIRQGTPRHPNFGVESARRYARETRSDPKVRAAIVDQLAALAKASIKHRDAQRTKATKRRGAGDDGRTTLELIVDVVKQHPAETTPDELLPHVHSAIEAQGMRPITDKWARELVRQARKAPAA